jgi:hypothetical protein
MNKLEITEAFEPEFSENKTKLLDSIYHDRTSFNEYIHYMIGVAKLKDSVNLLHLINTSFQNQKTLDDIHLVASFLTHCNHKGEGGGKIPYTERKNLSSRFERVLAKMNNGDVLSSQIQREFEMMRGTVNFMIYHCSN